MDHGLCPAGCEGRAEVRGRSGLDFRGQPVTVSRNSVTREISTMMARATRLIAYYRVSTL